MIEKDFVTEGLKRTRIDEYLEKELDRAGYGGMEIQVTPLGTMVVVYAERPGMVIGRGGKTVRAITNSLKNNYELENPQVEVKEVDIPELNPKIMAHKISAMLQRGMHFRRVAYSALRRIIGAGAQGVEVTISGKIRGSRSACAKFTDGYIKRCGEPSTKYVKEGFATVQLKPGVLGIYVRIMPPNVTLPDKVDIIQPKVQEPSVDVSEEPVEEITEGTVEILEEITEEAAEEAEEVPAEEPGKKADIKTEAAKTKKAAEEKVEQVKESVEEKAEEITKKVEEAEKKASEAAEKVEEKAEEITKKVEEAEKKAFEAAEKVEEKASEVKEAAKEKVEEVKEKVSKTKTKAAKTKKTAEKKAEEAEEKTSEEDEKASKTE